jgi:SAM-dependent methyltransferase
MSEELPMKFDPPLERCPLCGDGGIVPYHRDHRGITIFRCRRCGVQFMNPQYTDAYLAAFYAQYITAEYPFGPEILAVSSQRRREICALIGQHVPVGRLLSIGCGDGLELEIARQQGWTVEGYDVDPATTERVARKVGVPVYSGDLCALRLPEASYDCVYMDHVLEHPKRPQELLREARRLLRSGGVLFVGCPNIRSIASATKTWLEKLGLKRHNRGRHYDTHHHLFYYSPGVLRRILERHYGFRVLLVQGDPLVWRRKLPSRLYILLCHRLPCLDSTFRVLARREA